MAINFSHVLASRGLPNSVTAERAVLGCLLLESPLPNCPIVPDDFFLAAHRHIYAALMAMAEERKTLEFIGLMEHLNDRHQLEEIGGAPYIATLTDGLPRNSDIERYAEIVRQYAARRRALTLAIELCERAYGGERAGELAEGFLEASNALGGDGAGSGMVGLGAMELEAAAAKYAREIDRSRIATGIPSLDEHIGGISSGQVLTILARTGVGKSAIAQNFSKAFLRGQRDGCTIFCSAEMPADQFWIRQRQIEHGRTKGAVIAQYRSDADAEGDGDGYARSVQGRILCIPRAKLRLSDIERIIEREHRLGRIQEPRQVVLDYLALFRPEKTTRSDTEYYGEIAKGAKIMAKNLGVAVVLLVQSNRVGGNGTTPVNMQDARQSGEIEEASDFMLGAWRPGLSTGDPRAMKLALVKGRDCALREFDVIYDGPTLTLKEPQTFDAPLPAEWQ